MRRMFPAGTATVCPLNSKFRRRCAKPAIRALMRRRFAKRVTPTRANTSTFSACSSDLNCHGLPIEFKVSQEMRKAGNTSADAATIRKACDAYARKYIDLQRMQFKRLGVLGDWDNPYLTLNKEYEADELRLFADIVEKGFVYRGKKPVYWSIPCRTALAEAEVEYNEHTSTSIYVKFQIVGEPNTYILIWTTTPWTLPANLAVPFNSTFNYTLVRVGEEMYVLSNALLSTIMEKCGWAGYEIVRTLTGDQVAQLE